MVAVRCASMTVVLEMGKGFWAKIIPFISAKIFPKQIHENTSLSYNTMSMKTK